VSALDLTSLSAAIAQLAAGLAQADADRANELARDGVIQRFEYTYELSWKMLKRHLEQAAADPATLDATSFQDLIRTGAEQGLLRSGLGRWKDFRRARGITSHIYDDEKAAEVYAVVPVFLEEVRFLYQRLDERQRRV